MKADVEVARAGGNTFMVRPMSRRAKKWVAANVQLEDWQWLGTAFVVDQHYIENLVEGMRNDGLAVR